MPIPPVPVFQGITEQEWAQMAAACPMARRLYEKGQTIFRQGEPAREMAWCSRGRSTLKAWIYGATALS